MTITQTGNVLDVAGGDLIVAGDISSSGDLYGQFGTGLVVSSSISDSTVFTVKHPETGSLMTVKATNDSGSIHLSGSLKLNNNSLQPSDSGSKLYQYDGALYWGGGSANVMKHPIAPKVKQYYSHNFYDNIGTSTVYFPWYNQSEYTVGYGVGGNLFPCNAKLLKVFGRVNGVTGDADWTIGLKRYPAASTSHNAIGTKIVSVTTNTDYDVVFWDWEGTLDSGTNEINAGDLVSVYIDSSATVTSNQHWNFTTVWELDYSTELTASITA